MWASFGFLLLNVFHTYFKETISQYKLHHIQTMSQTYFPTNPPSNHNLITSGCSWVAKNPASSSIRELHQTQPQLGTSKAGPACGCHRSGWTPLQLHSSVNPFRVMGTLWACDAQAPDYWESSQGCHEGFYWGFWVRVRQEDEQESQRAAAAWFQLSCMEVCWGTLCHSAGCPCFSLPLLVKVKTK